MTLGVLALAVALEHSGLGHGEMSDTDMGQAISMCLAIVQAGAVLVRALALARTSPRFARALVDFFAPPLLALPATSTAIPPSRAGPPVLQVFRR